ncbi:phenylalanine--tRNA ligase subunit beta [Acetobacter oeni]|uniref:Phenylalanine--tRNA ligase beta subunit n=1 Tax=Acetobacter oeni TaxID=304077 RepID=A0A511XJK3_9PROT|nr:phenylalanine--tRNA ligase subunit beta [Acetobacter oeni]MBB3883346.1 phenylalanyl-tRNA synthetase beta chain [Acetobacter oeni]NHO19486.1 phenylalanine--tRNA ligase subunit beta [Acetobacter oeni]GBR00789.1 phenylalanyl-tRNA synthetase subunit beta [Acetobacter oeni LMG 21952]GEN63127.1 phenylalanine--tRNA ligase beta subunit [Acetobacter oeni]
MKFSLSWLHDHLETSATVEEICNALNRIGLEVEHVEQQGAQLEPFCTARILEAVQHPNADRLRVCKVDAGPEHGEVQVVCGAPNARPGIAVIFAPPDTFIPGSGITIKPGKIRGEASGGMLCSLRELGLGEETDGIAELPEDTLPGQSYADFAGLDDTVIEIGVTPNRGDALAVYGIARDLAAAGLGELRPFLADTVEGTFPSAVSWNITCPEACPWVLGRTIRSVRNGPSPKWLRDKLESVGLRSISTLVDITNLFTIDLGRPLHVFDTNRIKGDVLTICRGAGESIRALDGKDYIVTSEDCVIADGAGVQSIAGIMGGAATEVRDETTDVFIECALFDPVHIALTGRRLGISSDARYRFERGVDQAMPVAALEAATRLIMDLCGGEASEVVSAGAQPHWQRDARLRFERIVSLGGLAVEPDEAVKILGHLGFEVRSSNEDAVTVSVPSWRNDVAQPVVLDPAPTLTPDQCMELENAVARIEPECDLIEEVLRITGLDKVPPQALPPVSVVPGASVSPARARIARLRRVLATRGLMETIGFSFVAHDEAAKFGDAPESLRLLNPIAADLDQMRPTPLPGLLMAARRNDARGWPDLGLFEIGAGFTENGQATIAAGLRSGHTPRQPGGGGEPMTFMAAKADVVDILQSLGVSADALTVTSDAPGYYHPGRSGVFRLGPKTVLATFGELHPSLVQNAGFDAPVVAFEVFPDRIGDPKRRRKAAPNLSVLQPLRRDFAFLVANDVPVETILRAARGAERKLVTGVSLFDIYEGSKLPEGQKSVGIEVTLQPQDTSLTDAEIEKISDKIVAAVMKATNGTLRS